MTAYTPGGDTNTWSQSMLSTSNLLEKTSLNNTTCSQTLLAYWDEIDLLENSKVISDKISLKARQPQQHIR
jgi:hypothetical protein